MKPEIAIRSAWSELVVDPSDEQFFDQAVSIPTRSRPIVSTVRDDIWYFPLKIVAGVEERKAVIDFGVPCGDGLLTDDRYASLLHVCKCYALLKMGRPFRGFLDLSTIKRHVEMAFLLLNAIGSSSFAEGRRRLADQSLEDIRACAGSISKNWQPGSTSFTRLRAVFDELRRYGEAGLIADWFAQIDKKQIRDLCKAKDSKPHAVNPDRAEHATPPLPPLYCGKMLEIANFYVNKFAGPIIERVTVAARYRREETELREREPDVSWRDPRLAGPRYADWSQRNPWPIETLPFAVNYPFPSHTLRGLFFPLACLQAATMQTIALGTGFRTSEFVVMERNCRDPSTIGPDLRRLTTSRYKNLPDVLSEPVSWDVPEWMSKCIDVQLSLGDALQAPAVWHCLASRSWGKRLKSNVEEYLQLFADQHDLDASLGGCSNVSLQRFRTTVAREIIVSPDGHLRLLQWVLGHKRIETTLAYIKMNPYLQADFERARHRRIGRNPAGLPGIELRIHDVEAKMPSDALAELIAGATKRGLSLRLLGPGIIAPVSDEGGASLPNAFDAEAVRSDALAFALQNLSRRDIRAVRAAHDWYLKEARRLYSSLIDKSSFEPSGAHEAAMLEIVRTEA